MVSTTQINECEHFIYHPPFKSDEWFALFDMFEKNNYKPEQTALIADQLFGLCEARIQQREKEGK